MAVFSDMGKATLWHCQIQIVYWPLLKLLEALVSVAEPKTSQEVTDLSEKLQMLGRMVDEQSYGFICCSICSNLPLAYQGWRFPLRSLRQAAEEALERDPPQHTWLPEGCEDAPPDRGNLPGKFRFGYVWINSMINRDTPQTAVTDTQILSHGLGRSFCV